MVHIRYSRLPPVLIAPLGSKPQLVTITLDLLLARGEAISDVVPIHTSLERPETNRSATLLAEEFPRAYPTLRLHPICLCAPDGRPLEDIDTEEGVRESFRVLYREIRAAKQAGRRVHLSITGGRKTLAVFGIVAAQLLFDEGDCAWQLFSSPELIASQALHPGPGQAHLLAVPVLRWSRVSPVLTDLAMSEDPFEAVVRQEALRQADALQLARSFVRLVLTEAERQVVELVVCEGLSDRQVAARLGRSVRTVGHQLSSAYDKAHAHFGVDGVNRHTLMVLLTSYFAFEGRIWGNW